MLGSSGLSKPFASHGRNSKAIPSMPIPAALRSRASKGRIRAAMRWLTPSLTGSTLRPGPGYARKDHYALSGQSHWKAISAGTALARDGEGTACSAIEERSFEPEGRSPKGRVVRLNRQGLKLAHQKAKPDSGEGCEPRNHTEVVSNPAPVSPVACRSVCGILAGAIHFLFASGCLCTIEVTESL